MRHDRLYLADILQAAQKLSSFAQGRTRLELEQDDLFLSAVLHQLTVIGEAASRMSQELRDRHPEVAWRLIAGMRNYIVHAYFSMDLDILWETLTVDIPKLRLAVLAVSQDEFGHYSTIH